MVSRVRTGTVFGVLQCAVYGSFYCYPIVWDVLKTHFSLTQTVVNLSSGLLYTICMLTSLVLPSVHRTEEFSGRHAALGTSTASATVGYLLLAWCTFTPSAHAVLGAGLLIGAAVFISISEGVNFTNGLMVLLVDARWSMSAVGGVGSLVFGLGGVVTSLAFMAALQSGEVSGLHAARWIVLGLAGSFLVTGALTSLVHFRLSRAPAERERLLSAPSPGVQELAIDESERPSVRGALAAMCASPTDALASVLAVITLCLQVGIGSAAIANSGTLATSLAVDSYVVSRTVTVILLAQTAGRLLLAVLSREGLFGSIGKRGVKIFLPASLFVAFGFTAVFVFVYVRGGVDRALLVPYGGTLGLFYGAMWTVSSGWMQYLALPTRPQDTWFPHVNMLVSPLAGLAALGVNLAVGMLYDATADGRSACVGVHCYRSSFRLLAGLACLQLVCALALVPLHAMRMRRYLDGTVPLSRAWLL